MAQTIDFTIGKIKTTAMVAAPPGKGPFPGIVLTFHKDGNDGFTERMVDEFARQGFVVISPNHYHVLPPGQGPEARQTAMTDEQTALDLRAAAAWLAAQDNVAGKRYGLVGHCMGGRSTWVGLVDAPELFACGCVWYGGGAKRQQGKLPPPAERFAELQSPVMGFFGNQDKNPSPADVNEFDATLTRLGKWHEFHRYENTEHGFMNTESSHYREHAAKDSWTRSVAFLRKHLGVAAPVKA